MSAGGEYSFSPVSGDSAELAEACELFGQAFGPSSMQPPYLDWLYNKNPEGAAIGFNARFRGQLVAHLASVPVRARRFGQITKGLVLVNGATHPEHQKRGLLTTLSEMVDATALELGHEFAVGVANNNSVHGFAKLGYQTVTQLELRLVSTVRAKSQAQPVDFAREWSREAVAWRMQNPTRDYTVKPTRSGVQIHSRTSRFPALVGLLPPDRIPADAELTRSRHPFRVWIGVDNGVDWGRSLQIKVPSRLKPTPLNLIYRDLAGQSSLDARAVKFWAMDFDAY